MTAQTTMQTSDNPLWFKDAVFYEVHVKTFCDGNGDGIGDFKGLTSKLDYLEDLGITVIWLLPFYPSPLRDDGYDTADYRDVHPDYGTLRDFKKFLKEAHARGIRVLTELVLNHTSDQHKWFQRARNSRPGTVNRDFYVWSDTPHKYEDARIIFQDFEHSNWAYDPVAKSYYWHRFYHHQPDLNFDNPRVHTELIRILDFWFNLGVDGVRLDAVPYLYEREGTNCENLPETYEFLKKLRAHVDEKYPGRIFLAEANQWPEDAVKYFGDGDMCHMAFHFPLMPRMFMALEMENKHPILDILEQTPRIPENCQWAMFLRNHDELTLEMVTDEERDYMYRIYSQDPTSRINLGIRRRLSPLLDDDRRKIELMNVLLFSMPGSPVIYYGDEVGMGDNYYLGDRDGVRTPMQWNSNKNAGFSDANPQRLYLPVIIDPKYHFESVNVETQEHSQSSLLWWMRRLISVRNQYKAFGRGEMEFLPGDDPKVLAFLLRHEDETILVVCNLSRFARMAELDLSGLAGHEPEEIFGRTRFKTVEDSPYPLTLGPYGYHLFLMRSPEETQTRDTSPGLAEFRAETWATLLEDRGARTRLEKKVLLPWIRQQRWFGGKARKVLELKIISWPRLGPSDNSFFILMVEVKYDDGDPEIYVIPLAFREMAPDEDLPRGTLLWLKTRKRVGAVHDAVFNESFCEELLATITRRRKLNTGGGRLSAEASKLLTRTIREREVDLKPKLMGAEQSNTSIRYGNDLILKLYRRTEVGVHPDQEIVQYLSGPGEFEYIPPFAGSLHYDLADRGKVVLGLMQQFMPNQGDAWEMTLDMVTRYYERALSMPEVNLESLHLPDGVLQAALEYPFPDAESFFRGFAIESASLLGRRTAQMHLALAANKTDPGFVSEPFSQLYQRSLFQSMRNRVRQEIRLLKRNAAKLPEHVRGEAKDVLDLEGDILERMRSITRGKIDTRKIRIHGDYHLGQVLFTGKDFVIFDFEGEPARSLSERRLKRSPIRDVAGMIRSYHYAAYSPLLMTSSIREEDVSGLEAWAELWYVYIGGVFLRSYLEMVESTPIIPKTPEMLESMLTAFLLEKALYEMGYELNNRPEWLVIPLRGIKHLCGAPS
jgi:maltose alpha-D-glucosyltransferase/alpha-amylase